MGTFNKPLLPKFAKYSTNINHNNNNDRLYIFPDKHNKAFSNANPLVALLVITKELYIKMDRKIELITKNKW